MWCFYDSGWVFLIVIQKAEKQKCRTAEKRRQGDGKIAFGDDKIAFTWVLCNNYLTKQVHRTIGSFQGWGS
jgi:hypothetical protein